MAGFLFVFVSSFGGGYGRWLREFGGEIWHTFWLDLLYLVYLGLLYFLYLIWCTWWLDSRFGVLAGVLGVLGFSVLFVARFGVYLVDVLWCALVAEFGVLAGWICCTG